MELFSKRNKTKKEYSGHEIASINLRNRLLLYMDILIVEMNSILALAMIIGYTK